MDTLFDDFASAIAKDYDGFDDKDKLTSSLVEVKILHSLLFFLISNCRGSARNTAIRQIMNYQAF
jgi:hypothetical protein